GCSDWFACRSSPAAVTTWKRVTLSQASATWRASQPIPPPRVRPPTPVWETLPAGGGRPERRGGRGGGAGKRPPRTPPRRPAGARRGQAARGATGGDRDARHAVAAAAHPDVQATLGAKAHGGRDVGWAGAAGDDRRLPVDHRVPDPPGRLVAVRAGQQELAG